MADEVEVRTHKAVTILYDEDFESFYIKYPDGYMQPQRDRDEAIEVLIKAVKQTWEG